MSEEKQPAAEPQPLTEKDVQGAHAAVVAGVQEVQKRLAYLVSLAPVAEQDGKKIRMITDDMLDSMNVCRGNMKQTVLNALVIAQGLMSYTAEAREAAIAARGPKETK